MSTTKQTMTKTRVPGISKIMGTQGVSYLVRVECPRDPVTGKRKQRSESFKTMKAAEVARAKWVTEIENGTAIDATKMTMGEYLVHWLEAAAKHHVRHSTYVSYKGLIDNHLVPSLGSVPLQKLQAVQVQAMYSEKLCNGRIGRGVGGLSPRTVRYLHTVLREALQQAMKWGMVARNVCDLTEPPRVVRPQMQTWTPDEARVFLATAKKDAYAALWVLALTTGMRRGEMLGLRWEDIEFRAGTLRVRRTLNATGGNRYYGEPKTASGRRVIALSPECITALKGHHTAQKLARLAAGPGWHDEDLVFTTGAGGPVWPDDITHRFAALVKAAEVSRIRLHDLRHCHATLLLKQGIHLKVVSERLGHTGIQITADVYSHVSPTMQQHAATQIDAALFGEMEEAAVTVVK